MKYESIIGLEVHAQLLTESKIFCRCSTEFGNESNSQVCPICLGLPGILPVLNRNAVELAIKIGLAMNCRVASHSTFARKNYFYPDLPKGYQISQYDEPLCRDGFFEIEIHDKRKKIDIQRIHLEEDAGKSIHKEAWVGANESLLDLNRCGIALVEIVTRPVIRSPHEAFIFLTKLRQLLRYLEICDGNMEAGSLRCDANISIRPGGRQDFGVKTELKNMNSFHGVEKALTYEIERQVAISANGGTVQHETLLWDERERAALPMRSKEHAPDYRYFPEPDLVPLQIDRSWIERIQREMPELPMSRRDRILANYKIPKQDAEILTTNRVLVDYFEQVAQLVSDPKLVSHWIRGEVMRVMNQEKEVATLPMSAEALAELLNLINEGTISQRIAREIFQEMLAAGKSATTIMKEKNLVQVSSINEIAAVITKVISNHPEQVNQFHSGRIKLFDFFFGEVMKETGGKANPLLVHKILHEKLAAL